MGGEARRERRLGDKTQAGFYKKVGKEISTLDWKTLEYGPQQKVEDPALAALMKQPLQQRLKSATELPGKYGASCATICCACRTTC